MKKRLLSLFLCLLMLGTSFLMAACGDDEGALEKLGSGSSNTSKYGFTTTSSNDPLTISIYSIRGKGTTDEAIELVERELSRIAINRYNTAIDLVLIDEEDYASMIFTKVRTAIAAHNTSLIKDIATVDEKTIAEIRKNNVDYYYEIDTGKKDKNGNIIYEKRPYGVKEATNLTSDVLNGTLDIFLCYTPEEANGGNGSLFENGEPLVVDGVNMGMFEILYNEKALASLSKDLNTMYSELKNIPYSHAYEYVTRPADPLNSGSALEVFAIPNNYTYGSYDYIIFNEEYVSEFTSPFGNGSDKSIYKDVDSVIYKQLVSEIKGKYENINSDKKIFTEIEFSSYDEYYKFISGDYNNDLSRFLKDGQNASEYTNRFAIATIRNTSVATKTLLQDKNDKFDYDVYEIGRTIIGPTNTTTPLDKTASGLCDSMYCIGRNALGPEQDGVRVKRCLDILKLINTNVEFRNILQYGVKGTHYTQYSEDEDVHPISNGAKAESRYDQSKVAKYLGNMFLLYPSSDMQADERLLAQNKWQLAKEQVFELVPYLRYKKDAETQ